MEVYCVFIKEGRTWNLAKVFEDEVDAHSFGEKFCERNNLDYNDYRVEEWEVH